MSEQSRNNAKIMSRQMPWSLPNASTDFPSKNMLPKKIGGLVSSGPQPVPAPDCYNLRRAPATLGGFDVPPAAQMVQPAQKPKTAWLNASKMAARPRETAPLIQLTTNIMRTYLSISSKRKKLQAHPPRLFNDGCDDQNHNYIIRPNEVWAERYRVVKMLGKGSFGQVVEAWDTVNRELVAIKIIKNRKAFHAQGLIEMQILGVLNSHDPNDERNIVRLKTSFQHKNHLCLVYELLSFNLYELLRNGNFEGVSLRIVKKFAIQIVQTLEYLSRPEISVIHCDLKPENVLLAAPKSCKLKVVDFGSSCFIDQKIYSYIQSRFYRSPEIILGHSYGVAIDMWSLACMLVELHTGQPLFNGSTEHEQLCYIQELLGPCPEHYIKRSSQEKLSKFYSFVPVVAGNGLTGEEFSWFKHILNPSSKIDYSTPKRMLADIVMKIKSPEQRNARLGEISSEEMMEYSQFIDFLQRVLVYESEKRMSPSDALKHPFLKMDQGTSPMVLRRRTSKQADVAPVAAPNDFAMITSPDFSKLKLTDPTSLNKKKKSTIT